VSLQSRDIQQLFGKLSKFVCNWRGNVFRTAAARGDRLAKWRLHSKRRSVSRGVLWSRHSSDQFSKIVRSYSNLKLCNLGLTYTSKHCVVMSTLVHTHTHIYIYIYICIHLHIYLLTFFNLYIKYWVFDIFIYCIHLLFVTHCKICHLLRYKPVLLRSAATQLPPQVTSCKTSPSELQFS
jgi:hypothetical protein